MTGFEQPLAGWCPACGTGRLHADVDGRVVCRYPGCPLTDAVHELLSDPQTRHVVAVDAGGGFTVAHPLIERVGGELFTCDVHAMLAALDLSELPAGRYAIRTDVIHGVLYEPLSSQPYPRGAGLSPAPDPGG